MQPSSALIPVLLLVGLPCLASCASGNRSGHGPDSVAGPQTSVPSLKSPNGLVRRSEEEWRQLLTPEQFRVTRHADTERAFTGLYWDEHGDGVYHCVGCGLPLFDSETKFVSGTGWPSFWQPLSADAVEEREDHSLFSTRTEIRCSRCEAHLGHVFRDGPEPTGLRYCMNSAALDLQRQESGVR